MKLYAAVIEWPSDIGDPPELVLTTTPDEIHAATRDKIAQMLDATVPEVFTDFRAAFTADPDNYIDLIADADYSPFVTFYTQEVPA